ncbi:MAG TPA: helix-turn-helix domain-containing protein [Acidimicrobiia bacterium]
MSIQALNLVLERQVGSATKKSVLLCLANHADSDWATFVGQDRIAAQTELSVRTVRKALAELEEEGLIARRIRHRSTGRGRTSDYTTLMVAAIQALPKTPAVTLPDQPAGDAGYTATNRHLVSINRHVVPDQPAPAAGEPSDNHQKNLGDQPAGDAGYTPEGLQDHIHEFETIRTIGDREYKACKLCGVGPHLAGALGVEIA